MTLKAECASLAKHCATNPRPRCGTVAKLGGNVELVGRGSLPNDGKVISDER